MDRKEFFTASLKGGLGCCALVLLEGAAPPAAQAAETTEVDREKEFVKNWMSDLFDSLDKELDETTKVRVMAGCGQGCFRRHQFKQDIARQGQGSVEKLLQAYKKNFQVWQEGGLVHIRYGEVTRQCYCPAARYHPAKTKDMHCECTRATHQAMFETALGRPIQVEILDTLRRGGKNCHFVAHVA